MISGRQNASVFPEPVKAIPIISRPENLNIIQIEVRLEACDTYAAGIPCNWIGVGIMMRLDLKWSSIGSGIFISYRMSVKKGKLCFGIHTSKCSMGGGTSSPSTNM
jgi:hypothetical protein